MSKKERDLDPRVRRTRQLLHDALIELIPEKGYNDITIQDITDRATLNRATFYLHYRDKHDLLLQTTENLMNELKAEYGDIVVTEVGLSHEATLHTNIKTFEHFQRYADFYQAMLGFRGSIDFALHLQETLQTLTTSRFKSAFGTLPEEPVPTEIVFRYASSAQVGIIHWWLENDMPFTPDEMAVMSVELYAHGVFKVMGLDVKGD